MIRVIEFIILVFCIATACGIITWALLWENKHTKTNKRKDVK